MVDQSKEIDSSYIADCRAAYIAEVPTYINIILYTAVAFFIIFFLWAYFSEIDETTNGEGKVIPSSKVQVVQNLEGGIVASIHVRDGQKVEKGDKLMNLDATRFGSSYQEQFNNYKVLLSNIARLSAQADLKEEIDFPHELTGDDSDVKELREQEIKLFKTNMSTLQSELDSHESALELAQNELNIVLSLVEEGLMSQIDKLRLEREVTDLKRKIQESRDHFVTASRTELNEKQAELTSLNEALKGLRDRMVRTIIRSPLKGTVHNLKVNTIGGVIKPGMDILEIVPIEDSLLIEANIRPMDIAFVHPKQKVNIKVTAYDFSIYGGLEGEVSNISPDTIQDEKGNSFYVINVITKKAYLGTEQEPLNIIPGMTVTVHVLTGKKSILTYLFKPILKAKEKAFSER